jgi:multidrug efflux pump subunit AcrA (membrane-fusion protein)
VLQTTSTQLVVSVNLDATKQSEAVVGAPVTVQLSDGSTDSGKISKVSTVAQASSSSSSSGGGGGGSSGSSSTPSSTVPVTIALSGRRHVAGLDQAAVSVNFEQQVQRGVLAVPVTALLATAGGGYAVETVGGGQKHLVPVTPGLFAGGYVEVSGAGLSEGMRVSDAQG